MTDPSLERLYRKHAPAAFSRCLRMLGSEADAHEVVHDVFLSLHQRPEQFRGGSSMTTFLYSAVTHACLNKIRNEKSRLRLLQERAVEIRAGGLKVSPDTWTALRGELERMPEVLAQVAVYHHLDGMSRVEIAEVLQCSVRSVATYLERLRGWARTLEVAG